MDSAGWSFAFRGWHGTIYPLGWAVLALFALAVATVVVGVRRALVRRRRLTPPGIGR